MCKTTPSTKHKILSLHWSMAYLFDMGFVLHDMHINTNQIPNEILKISRVVCHLELLLELKWNIVINILDASYSYFIDLIYPIIKAYCKYALTFAHYC